MKDLNQKIRIKDIATLAGVSEGTVDRVIHQRGDVSVKSRDAVLKVLNEMNYTPNLFARSLASKKQYRYVCLYPEHQSADYWEDIDKGFDLASQDFLHYNVKIEKKYYNQFDVKSFVNASNEILSSKPDAVFIAPIFRTETLIVAKKLSNNGIPFSFIDSIVEEADFLTYYGQNSFQSGYIAAKLIMSSLPEGSQILVIRTQRSGSFSNQTIARNKGFIEYIYEHKLDNKLELINIEFNNEDEDENRKVIIDVFEKNKKIKAAITFNSKVYRLAEYLESLNYPNINIVGYDLLDKNVKYLKQGAISYLIAQRPDKQAFFTVRDMCRQLIFNQKVKRINYVPIDILIKENIEDYMHFIE